MLACEYAPILEKEITKSNKINLFSCFLMFLNFLGNSFPDEIIFIK
jgi:hypothetical protein